MITSMDDPEELLDLVDEHDAPIGIIPRSEILSIEATSKGFARGVGIFLVNGEGKLWIPRRTMHKKIAPGGLDFSAGEHVGHGEPYQAAALRGLQEELNINPTAGALFYIGTVPPFAGMPYFHEIFGYHSDAVPEFNTNDFSGYEWLTPQEVHQKLTAGEPAKEILLPSLELALKYLEDKGDN